MQQPHPGIVLDSMKEGVLALDALGRIILFNDAAAAILELPAEGVLQHTYAEVFLASPGADALTQLILDAIQHGQHRTCHEISFKTRTGTDLTLQVTTSYLKENGQLGKAHGIVAVFRNVTELKALADKKAALARQLEETNQELQKAYLNVEAKNRELSDAVHRVQVLRIAITVVVLLLVAGLTWYSAGFNYQSLMGSSVASDAAPAAPSRSYRIKRGEIVQIIRLAGYLEPGKRTDVVVPISGKIVSRYFQLGEWVVRNQLLAEIQVDGLENRLRSAKIAALRAGTRLRALEQWTSSNEVQEAKRNLSLAELSLGEQKRELEEAKRLYEKDIISRQELNGYQSALKRAEIAVETARQGLFQVESRASKEALREARLEVQMAEDELDRARAQAQQREVRSPVAGLAVVPPNPRGQPASLPRLGDLITPGMILVSVVNVDSLSVTAKVDELVVHLIKREQPAVIHFDAFPELELAGQVQYISSQAAFEGTTPYFEIKVDILDPVSSAEDLKLRLGMSADVTITTVDRKDVLKIPLEALQGSDGDYYVWHQVDRPTGSVLSKRDVSIGVRDSRWVEIVAGLQENDTILY